MNASTERAQFLAISIITHAIIETAKNRAHILRGTHEHFNLFVFV
jgi:hypothetical protein